MDAPQTPVPRRKPAKPKGVTPTLPATGALAAAPPMPLLATGTGQATPPQALPLPTPEPGFSIEKIKLSSLDTPAQQKVMRMKVSELKDALRAKGLPVEGLKKALQARLLNPGAADVAPKKGVEPLSTVVRKRIRMNNTWGPWVETPVPQEGLVLSMHRNQGVICVYRNFESPESRKATQAVLATTSNFRQYKFGNVPEPRVHMLLAPQATTGLGYAYHGITMRAEPIEQMPCIQTLAEKCTTHFGQPWNVGVDVVAYRDGHDSCGWHADDTQGETLIVAVVLQSSGGLRSVKFRPKKPNDKYDDGYGKKRKAKQPGERALSNGDEELELWIGEGDAYSMDKGVQIGYEHSVPKQAKSSEIGRRIVAILREGKDKQVVQGRDTGIANASLDPPERWDYAKGARFGKVEGVDEGSVENDANARLYSRETMCFTGAHNQAQRGVGGSIDRGAESIVVSRCSERMREADGASWLRYTSTRRQGAGALWRNLKDNRQPVRVFRSSKLTNPWAPPLLNEKREPAQYRYDGLYDVTCMWDDSGAQSLKEPQAGPPQKKKRRREPPAPPPRTVVTRYVPPKQPLPPLPAPAAPTPVKLDSLQALPPPPAVVTPTPVKLDSLQALPPPSAPPVDLNKLEDEDLDRFGVLRGDPAPGRFATPKGSAAPEGRLPPDGGWQVGSRVRCRWADGDGGEVTWYGASVTEVVEASGDTATLKILYDNYAADNEAGQDKITVPDDDTVTCCAADQHDLSDDAMDFDGCPWGWVPDESGAEDVIETDAGAPAYTFRLVRREDNACSNADFVARLSQYAGGLKPEPDVFPKTLPRLEWVRDADEHDEYGEEEDYFGGAAGYHRAQKQPEVARRARCAESMSEMVALTVAEAGGLHSSEGTPAWTNPADPEDVARWLAHRRLLWRSLRFARKRKHPPPIDTSTGTEWAAALEGITESSVRAMVAAAQRRAHCAPAVEEVLNDDVAEGLCALCGAGKDDEAAEGPLMAFKGPEGPILVHAACAACSSEVYYDPCSRLCNVLKAVKRGRGMRCAAEKACSRPRKSGATVGCSVAKCKRSYHVRCSLATGWTFGPNKTFFCKTHLSEDYDPADWDDNWWRFDCSCGTRALNYDDGKAMWECPKCESWQHAACAGGSEDAGAPADYACFRCRA